MYTITSIIDKETNETVTDWKAELLGASVEVLEDLLMPNYPAIFIKQDGGSIVTSKVQTLVKSITGSLTIHTLNTVYELEVVVL